VVPYQDFRPKNRSSTCASVAVSIQSNIALHQKLTIYHLIRRTTAAARKMNFGLTSCRASGSKQPELYVTPMEGTAFREYRSDGKDRDDQVTGAERDYRVFGAAGEW
jgi:hypothetical protein